MSDETIGSTPTPATAPAAEPAPTPSPGPTSDVHGLDLGKLFETLTGIVTPAVKAGYLTTEHAFSYILALLITAIGTGIVPVANVTAVVVALAVVGGTYSISRGLAKK